MPDLRKGRLLRLSPNRHASKHAGDAGHPIIRSLEPGEDWMWCYIDEVVLEPVSRLDERHDLAVEAFRAADDLVRVGRLEGKRQVPDAELGPGSDLRRHLLG